jgi:hypothetical protein
MRITMMFIVAAVTIACPALAQSTDQERAEQRPSSCGCECWLSAPDGRELEA